MLALGIVSLPLETDIGHGRLQSVLQLLQNFVLEPLVERCEQCRSVAGSSDAFDQVMRRAATETEGEDASLMPVPAHQADHLIRVRHLPVGQQKDLSQISLDLRLLEYPFQWFVDLRSTQISFQYLTTTKTNEITYHIHYMVI